MKKLLLGSFLFSLIFLMSCSKSNNDDNVNPIEKKYKALTSDNVSSFFVESSSAVKGCAGSNCDILYKFNCINLNYATDIGIYFENSNQITILWSLYTTNSQVVGIRGDYNNQKYRLRFTLKDGRVLTGSWVNI